MPRPSPVTVRQLEELARVFKSQSTRAASLAQEMRDEKFEGDVKIDGGDLLLSMSKKLPRWIGLVEEAYNGMKLDSASGH